MKSSKTIKSEKSLLNPLDLHQLTEAFKEVEDSYDTAKSKLNWLGHKYIVIDRQGNVSTTRLAFRATNLESIIRRIESTIQAREQSQDNPIEKENYKNIAQGLNQLSNRFIDQRKHSLFLFLRNILNFNRSSYSITETINSIILLSDLKAMGFSWKNPTLAKQDRFLRKAKLPDNWIKSAPLPNMRYNKVRFYIADQERNPRILIEGVEASWYGSSNIKVLRTPEEQARISKEWTDASEAYKKALELAKIKEEKYIEKCKKILNTRSLEWSSSHPWGVYLACTPNDQMYRNEPILPVVYATAGFYRTREEAIETGKSLKPIATRGDDVYVKIGKTDSAPSKEFSYLIPTLDTADMVNFNNKYFSDLQTRNNQKSNYANVVSHLKFPELQESEEVTPRGLESVG